MLLDKARLLHIVEGAIFFIVPVVIDELSRLVLSSEPIEIKKLLVLCCVTFLAWLRLQIPKSQPWDGIDRRKS